MELYLHFPLRLNGVQSDNLRLLHTIFVRDDTKRPYVQTYSPVLLCFVDRASRYNRVKKNQLDANLFLVYFVNLYMFRAYLGPSSGGTSVCIQQLVLIILF